MKNKLKTRVPILALILFVFTFGHAVAEPAKVIVIPLGANAPSCTVRESAAENLLGFGRTVTANCLDGEYPMSGGYTAWNYVITLDCRVIGSKPISDGWQVQWAVPVSGECEGNSVKTYVVCC